MKKIFEEYGFIILTCVVVIALVEITIGIKPLMADSISNITNSWGSKAKDSLNDVWNNNNEEQAIEYTEITLTDYNISYLAVVSKGATSQTVPSEIANLVSAENVSLTSLNKYNVKEPQYKLINYKGSYAWTYINTELVSNNNGYVKYNVNWECTPYKDSFQYDYTIN